jgi:hypothetical protein
MSRFFEEIDERIAEIEKHVRLDIERENRISDATAEFYARQEKVEIAGLAPLLEKVGKDPRALQGFFGAQEKEALQRIKTVTPLLQLTEEEIAHFDQYKRAISIIDPCLMVPPQSPEAKCSYLASSCGTSHWETADALGSCSCVPGIFDNECNPKVEARGQGSNGWRAANAKGWCYFDIPARTSPVNVNVLVGMQLHGFYILRSGTGSATFSLKVRAEGWQYGFSWAEASSTVLTLSGDNMGRYDAWESLNFSMPIGADPFVVRVYVELMATAKSGGALSVGDFATGNGNYIDTIYANTYD